MVDWSSPPMPASIQRLLSLDPQRGAARRLAQVHACDHGVPAWPASSDPVRPAERDIATPSLVRQTVLDALQGTARQ
jgi:hypothetical protein